MSTDIQYLVLSNSTDQPIPTYAVVKFYYG